jgi:hypothetical protein
LVSLVHFIFRVEKAPDFPLQDTYNMQYDYACFGRNAGGSSCDPLEGIILEYSWKDKGKYLRI